MNVIRLLGWDPIVARILWKHVGSTLLLILGAKVIFWAATHGIEDSDTLKRFLWVENFALLGIVVWFLRELAVEFWNRRKKIRRTDRVSIVWILGT